MTSLLGITIGDRDGIGPEVTLKALARLSRDEQTRFELYADRDMIADFATRLALPMPEIAYVSPAQFFEGDDASPENASARYAWASLQMASARLADGRIAGVATAPISKARMHRVGFPYPGHTEFFQAESGASAVRMMFLGDTLKVVLHTIHVPLVRVPSLLSRESLIQTFELTQSALQTHFACKSPKIAVCGLNPHAGEGGLLGEEEVDTIVPAIQAVSGVSGPFPSDSYFGMRLYEKYDATICLYHDQGLIPFKLLHFDRGVNMTIGLSYVRTSPDHGCAFDIAGQGIASSASMEEALRWLLKLV